MPQLELETYQRPNETEAQVFERLRTRAENKKSEILSQDDAIRVFDRSPAMQVIGKRVRCQWKYKQYPNFDSGADLSASKEE